MKKIHFPSLSLTLTLATVTLLSSCQTIEPFKIDYMIPAQVNFPETLRRVAVVNNTPALKSDQIVIEQNESEAQKSYWGDGVLATEELAKALADGNYFDEVIICDSALRATDSVPQAHHLTLDEVAHLTQQLDVDFIISLDAVLIKSQRKMEFFPQWNIFGGSVDSKVYTTTRIYLPQRQNAMATINANDSIFWESDGLTESDALRSLPNDIEVRNQSSQFAGTTPVNQLLPHWRSGQRYLYGGLSVAFRDAMIYVHEGDWNEAITLWEKEFDGKNKRRKKAAAYNLAVGYELQDQIDQALRWLKLSIEQTQPESAEQLMMKLYEQELQLRLSGMQQLQHQTKRMME